MIRFRPVLLLLFFLASFAAAQESPNVLFIAADKWRNPITLKGKMGVVIERRAWVAAWV